MNFSGSSRSQSRPKRCGMQGNFLLWKSIVHQLYKLVPGNLRPAQSTFVSSGTKLHIFKYFSSWKCTGTMRHIRCLYSILLFITEFLFLYLQNVCDIGCQCSEGMVLERKSGKCMPVKECPVASNWIKFYNSKNKCCIKSLSALWMAVLFSLKFLNVYLPRDNLNVQKINLGFGVIKGGWCIVVHHL